MFGIIVVGGKNDVLLASGDRKFREYVRDRIEKEIYRPSDTASTSSGVYTDSDVSPTSSLDRSNHPLGLLHQADQKAMLDDLPAIAHLFLPLISTYRTFAERDSPFESISHERTWIRFLSIDNGAVVISIAARETEEQRDFVDYFALHLRMRFGPLIELMNSGLHSVDESRRRIEDIMEDFCKGRHFCVRASLDCRRTATHSAQITRINAVVKSICDQLQIFIGSNRCFLMHGREVISTVNCSASSKPVWKQFHMEDINAVFDALKPLTKESPHEISQWWIRSSFSNTPFFVDIIRCRLTDQLELLCISESRSNALIRTICLLMEGLDKIPRNLPNANESVPKMEHYVEVATKLLVEMVFDRPPSATANSSFLRNPTKTANYFKTLWKRVKDELSHELEGPLEPPAKRQLFSGLRSTLSLLSISTFGSSNAQLNIRKNSLSMQMNVLLAYIHKQILNLLQEVCSDVKRDAAKYKLGLFQTSMNRIFRPRQEAQLAKESGEGRALASISAAFAPTQLRLAMYAYNVVVDETKLDISYVPEQYRAPMHDAISDGTEISYTDTKMPDGDTIYVVEWHPRIVTSKKSFLRKNTSSMALTVKAIFSSYVHRHLAMMQMQKLLEQFEPVLVKCAKFYN